VVSVEKRNVSGFGKIPASPNFECRASSGRDVGHRGVAVDHPRRLVRRRAHHEQRRRTEIGLLRRLFQNFVQGGLSLSLLLFEGTARSRK
jgi:hypothetical protein